VLYGQQQYAQPRPQINGDVFPGECAVDSDGDGVLDLFDNCGLFNPDQADCDGNGIGDVCDIQDHIDGGGSHEDLDCNWNWVPDDCEFIESDCNNNGLPDACEVNDGTALDCNANGLLDECELDSGFSPDCNGNGIPDVCDIDDGIVTDCNENGRPDSCDIDDGISLDENGDGIPDECCLADIPCDGINGLLVIINNLDCVGTPPTCPGDFNCSGLVDTGDILDYLSQCSFK
jgi:hypothetical protein